MKFVLNFVLQAMNTQGLGMRLRTMTFRNNIQVCFVVVALPGLPIIHFLITYSLFLHTVSFKKLGGGRACHCCGSVNVPAIKNWAVGGPGNEACP